MGGTHPQTLSDGKRWPVAVAERRQTKQDIELRDGTTTLLHRWLAHWISG